MSIDCLYVSYQLLGWYLQRQEVGGEVRERAKIHLEEKGEVASFRLVVYVKGLKFKFYK